MELIQLNTGDRIEFHGRYYKVMGRKDYSYMLPQLGFALSRYIKFIHLRRVTTTFVDYNAVNSFENFDFKGLVQPLSYKEIAIYPEEQRAFTWLKISIFSLNGNQDFHLVEVYQSS